MKEGVLHMSPDDCSPSSVSSVCTASFCASDVVLSAPAAPTDAALLAPLTADETMALSAETIETRAPTASVAGRWSRTNTPNQRSIVDSVTGAELSCVSPP